MRSNSYEDRFWEDHRREGKSQAIRDLQRHFNAHRDFILRGGDDQYPIPDPFSELMATGVSFYEYAARAQDWHREYYLYYAARCFEAAFQTAHESHQADRQPKMYQALLALGDTFRMWKHFDEAIEHYADAQMLVEDEYPAARGKALFLKAVTYVQSTDDLAEGSLVRRDMYQEAARVFRSAARAYAQTRRALRDDWGRVSEDRESLDAKLLLDRARCCHYAAAALLDIDERDLAKGPAKQAARLYDQLQSHQQFSSLRDNRLEQDLYNFQQLRNQLGV